MGSKTGLTSGRRKRKAVKFKRQTATPTIARSARTPVTLDIVILELPWLSIIVDAWFVSVGFVAITQTPSLAEEPARRSCLAGQVVGRVADPDLGGGQVAVLRLHAAGSWLRDIAPYSPNWASVSLNCSIYYNFLCELPRTPARRTSENSPSETVWKILGGC